MQKTTPTQKAWGATTLFIIAACVASLWAHTSVFFVPQLLFYLVLTLNSFYSIKLHSRVQPKDTGQAVIDFLLTIAYLVLALSISQPVLFPFFTLVIFVLAPAKYVLMLEKIPHPSHLKKKIIIDLAGTMLATFALGLVIIGSPLFAAWAMALINVAANIYYLGVKPMYLLSEA